MFSVGLMSLFKLFIALHLLYLDIFSFILLSCKLLCWWFFILWFLFILVYFIHWGVLGYSRNAILSIDASLATMHVCFYAVFRCLFLNFISWRFLVSLDPTSVSYSVHFLSSVNGILIKYQLLYLTGSLLSSLTT